MCMCMTEIEREIVNIEETENKKDHIFKKSNELLQREGGGVYVVTFPLYSFTTTTSWERGGDLTTY